MLQSAVLMLHHIHKKETAERIQKAPEKVYADGKVLTKDVRGTSGASAFADPVIAAMETAQGSNRDKANHKEHRAAERTQRDCFDSIGRGW